MAVAVEDALAGAKERCCLKPEGSSAVLTFRLAPAFWEAGPQFGFTTAARRKEMHFHAASTSIISISSSFP